VRIEPVIGMVVALCGVPVLTVAVRRVGADPLRLATRLTMWAMAALVIWLAQTALPNWHTQLGWRQPSGTTAVYALVGTLLALVGWPIVGLAQRAFGGTKVTDTEAFQKLIGIAPAYRAFLVLTAGVTEEVLFRGYAIGVGTEVLGSVWVAFTLSLLIFVAAHFRWGASHLISVTWAGLVLSALFVFSGDLLACILAHTLIDAVGVFLAPWGMAIRARRAAAPSGV
jgi:membrane protease YdiL (CAAX protease family)